MCNLKLYCEGKYKICFSNIIWIVTGSFESYLTILSHVFAGSVTSYSAVEFVVSGLIKIVGMIIQRSLIFTQSMFLI